MRTAGVDNFICVSFATFAKERHCYAGQALPRSSIFIIFSSVSGTVRHNKHFISCHIVYVCEVLYNKRLMLFNAVLIVQRNSEDSTRDGLILMECRY